MGAEAIVIELEKIADIFEVWSIMIAQLFGDQNGE